MSSTTKTREWTSAALDHPVIQYKADNGVAVVEMDDPPANTYTYAMMRQLDDAILKARFDDDVHVIVLQAERALEHRRESLRVGARARG